MRAVITPSRRTGEATKALIADALAAEPFGTLWDETGDNPYFGILALADRLIVTAESISMISEALATGRPVHVLPLEGRGSRHEAFLDACWQREARLADRRRRSRLGRSPASRRSTPAPKPAQRLRAMLGLARPGADQNALGVRRRPAPPGRRAARARARRW